MTNITQEEMQLFKDLINERFNGLTILLKSIDDHLKHINGTVGEHDRDIRQAMVERSGNRQSQLNHLKFTQEIEKRLSSLENKVIDLEKVNINHVNLCPQAPRIKLLEEEMLKNIATKGFVIKAITVVGIIVSTIFAIYKMIGDKL